MEADFAFQLAAVHQDHQ